tara:strand:- start:4391 stop:6631 length:2241 start_codon:yes stop_codon:yes gene_type:complete
VSKFIDWKQISKDEMRQADRLQYAIGKGLNLGVGGFAPAPADLRIEGYEVLANSTEVVEGALFSKKQIIRVVGKASEFSSYEDWRRFLVRTVPQEFLFNHSFNFKKPPIIGTEGWAPLTSYVKTEFEFNRSFYDYERLTINLNTRLLPNYSLMQYCAENPLLLQHQQLLSYNGAITIPTMIGYGWYTNYYNSYVEDSYSVVQNGGAISDKNNNLFILAEDYNSGPKDRLPYCLKLSVAIKEVTPTLEFKDALTDYNRTRNVFQFIKSNPPVEVEFGDGDGGTRTDFKVYDLVEWLVNQGPGAQFVPGDDELFLSPKSEININSPFENILSNVMLHSWIKSQTSTCLKNIEDIYEYDGCYSQTFGFKIEKFLERDFGNPDQTIYVFGDNIHIIDTQVRYDQRYVYKITALTLVLGSKYRYSKYSYSAATAESEHTPINWQGDLYDPASLDYKYAAEIAVEILPSLKIMEVPVRTSYEHFVELPTNIPDYNFTNETGRVNELKIFLTNNFLAEKQRFLKITDNDALLLNKINLSQDNEGDMVETSYMYNSGRFEIYRIDDGTPKDISDFKNNLLVSISPENYDYLNIKTGDYFDHSDNEGYYTTTRYCAGSEFIDYVIPNKKYYYLFRALTTHNNPSPPSEVLEVELIEDSNGSYVVVNPFKFLKEEGTTYKKEMRRFMQIVPNPLQVQIDHDMLKAQELSSVDQLAGLPPLGVIHPALWKRKFKIRLTSKHTNKKIDINVIFDRKME